MTSIDLAKPKADLPSPMSESVAYGPRYPTVYIDTSEKLDLPDDGEIKFKFKKTDTSYSEHNGKTSYSCTLELHKILDANAETVDEDKKFTLKDIGIAP